MSKIQFKEAAQAPDPVAGYLIVTVRNGIMYLMNDTGAEVAIGGSIVDALPTSGGTLLDAEITRYSETVLAGASTTLDRADGGIQILTLTADSALTWILNDGEKLQLYLTPDGFSITDWGVTYWMTDVPVLATENMVVVEKVGGNIYAWDGGSRGGSSELDPDFVVVIDTTKGWSGLQTSFRFNSPDVVIDWGDGAIEPFQSASTIYCAHTYAEHGTYTIRISGVIGHVEDGGDLSAITHCLSIGDLTKDYRYLFYGAANLLSVPAEIYSGVTNMAEMFGDANSFNGDLSGWDVSSVTDMSYMFYYANSFNGDISSWDVSSVTDMTYMLCFAESFNQDLSGWCVPNITTQPNGFATGSALAPEHYPIWGTCP